jgi:hypothetical protein
VDSDSAETKSQASTNGSSKLESVKETAEEHLSDEQIKKREVFGKHKKNKINHYI